MTIQARATTFGPEGVDHTDIAFDLPRPTFRSQLRTAAEWALLFAVKLAIVLVFVLMAVRFVFEDYAQVRLGAKQGAAAFSYLQKAEDAAQARQKATPKPTEQP